MIKIEFGVLGVPVPGPALVGEAATHARTIFRGKNFEFKLFLEVEILSK